MIGDFGSFTRRGLLADLNVQTVLSERHRESVRFVRVERHAPCVGQVCDFIQICRVKRLLLADLRDVRWYGRGWSDQERDKEDFPERVGEIIDENQKKQKKVGSCGDGHRKRHEATAGIIMMEE